MFDQPHGVAPGAVPMAEATTGLAPKKASAVYPSVAATKSPSEDFDFEVAFDFDRPLSLVKLLRSGGLGPQDAKTAGLLLPGAPNELFGRCSRMSIGLLDGQPNRRGGVLPEALHPAALAAGVVILAG